MSERIRLLDDLGAELARVAAEAEAKGRARHLPRRARTLALAVGLTVLLGGTAYAVPATHGAVDGIADSLAGWVRGDGDAPGRPLSPRDDAPSWFGERSGDARVIAEADGVGLFVRHADSAAGPVLQLGLGPGLVMGDTLDGWRERLGDRAVYVLQGPPAAFGPRDLLDARGRFPLLGVTTRDVARVQLRYAEGPPLVADSGDGGFVLLADAWRPLRELVAYDRAGQVRGRVDLSNYDMSYLCEREPGCPSTTR